MPAVDSGKRVVLVLRAKDGPCPPNAVCVKVAKIKPMSAINIPDGEYLVVMSAAVADLVDIRKISARFKCIICVGPSTATAVGERCIVPRRYDSYGLVELLRSLRPGRVIVLRSAKGNSILRSSVPNVVEVPVYDLEEDPDGIATARNIDADVVVVASSYVAEIAWSHGLLNKRLVVAIGQATSERLRELGVSHYVSPVPLIKDAVEFANALRP